MDFRFLSFESSNFTYDDRAGPVLRGFNGLKPRIAQAPRGPLSSARIRSLLTRTVRGLKTT